MDMKERRDATDVVRSFEHEKHTFVFSQCFGQPLARSRRNEIETVIPKFDVTTAKVEILSRLQNAQKSEAC